MRVLALHGGGLFGCAQADILRRVPQVQSKFDCIAGTSVGSIVGAMIATGVPADKYLSFFTEYGPQIFAGHWWRQWSPFTPKYNDAVINETLKTILPGKFRDVKIPMFVTSADLNGRCLKVFYSGDKADGDLNLWEICRMAVAAETYFLPWQGMADGGIYANNPSMVAVGGALSDLHARLEDIELTAIGTGVHTGNTNVGSTQGWTLLSWGMYILQSALRGSANTMHDFFVNELPLKRHYSVQFERDSSWDMDDPACIAPALEKWQPQIIKAAADIANQ